MYGILNNKNIEVKVTRACGFILLVNYLQVEPLDLVSDDSQYSRQ